MMTLRVLLAEDSPLFATVLGELLSAQDDMELIAVTDNGEDAVRLCLELRPDLVLMDVQMPRMDGLAATERIMAQLPTPILVITSDPWRGGSDLSFKALSAGALELIPKPDHLPMSDAEQHELLSRIRLLSQIPVIRHMRGRRQPASAAAPASTPRVIAAEAPPIIGIVASTGGPRTLAALLALLPERFEAAILIVQHIIPGFSEHLARWLHGNTRLNVQEARAGVRPQAGHVYLAPSEHHLEVSPTGLLHVHDGPPVRGHRPSGDRLLDSLAQHAAASSIGLILSGMGDDGAEGLGALRRAGGITLAQEPASCVVPSMPQAAILSGAAQHIIEPADLPDSLRQHALTLCRRRR
jgi:two-component system chemotaxis response regulator CheB